MKKTLTSAQQDVMNTRVWARLPIEIHEYFFRGVLAGEHKTKQNLTALFWSTLYRECKGRNIPPNWSRENSALVHEIACQLTFPTPASPDHHNNGNKPEPALPSPPIPQPEWVKRIEEKLAVSATTP